ncbi:MAG TPA: hypothetical protein VM100_05385 [Longimicrobiales bacterium]|nr:hypothetical protein [Longimicrobiales bacterium]
MLKSFMLMQWKVSRWAVAILLPICFATPILVARFGQRTSAGEFSEPALDFLRGTTIWLPFFPVLAAITGLTFALTAWTWDHNTNHVYALSLPIERWRYSLMKMISGAAFMLVPVAALLVGALVAMATVKLPAGLHAYPLSFTVRFMFGALILYAIIFAMASGTVKTTLRIIIGIVLFFVLGSFVTDMLSDMLNTPIPSPIGIFFEALMEWPGPFNVFGGSWMLFDV